MVDKRWYKFLRHKKMFMIWLLLPLCMGCQSKETVVDTVIEDRMKYSLISYNGNADFGDTLVIQQLGESEEVVKEYVSDFLDLQPWKLEVGDVDGDRMKEILIAVRKTTHFDHQLKNRLFIFNFDGTKLMKKWTGSQIAGNWEHFVVGDVLPIPGDEVLFIEHVEGQGKRLHMVYWFHFGFVTLAVSEFYEEITNVQMIGNNRMLLSYIQDDIENTVPISVKDGKIIE